METPEMAAFRSARTRAPYGSRARGVLGQMIKSPNKFEEGVTVKHIKTAQKLAEGNTKGGIGGRFSAWKAARSLRQSGYQV
jgi:hypothetical protein